MAEKEKDSGMFEEFPPVTTQQWEEKIQADLKGADYEKKLMWKPIEGFRVRPYYRMEDLQELKHLQAMPGEYPYTRGHQEKDFRWQIREDIDIADIKETNQLALNAIKKGATSLSLNVKNVHTSDDLMVMLKDIDPEMIVLNFYSPFGPWKEFLEKFRQVLDEKGSDPAKVVGSVDFDPTSYALMHGDFYHGKAEDLSEAADLIRFAEDNLPAFRVITINGRYFQEAGSSAVQELGYSLASANQYLADLTAASLDVDEISRHMVFFFTTGSSYFIEIAKYRAARMLWAQITEKYKPQSEESMVMHIHANTLNWNKTVYDPYVNMLRTTTEAMSAALGGVDSFGVTPFDRHFREPDKFSRRIARNQQIIIQEESYLDRIVDPAGGSYYIENLTDSVAKHAWELFKDVEEKGGMIEAISNNIVQDAIETTAQQRDMNIARRKTVLLGSNQFPNQEESEIDDIQKSIFSKGPSIDGAFRTLRKYRGAEPFEALRLATEKHMKDGNSKPKVFLLTIGNPVMRKARAQFSNSFFGCAGYEIIDNLGFNAPDEGVKAAQDAGAEIVVICSSDDEYKTLAPEIAKKLKSTNAEIQVVVAGNPKDIVDELSEAGIDNFIHIKTKLLESLKKYHETLGIAKY